MAYSEAMKQGPEASDGSGRISRRAAALRLAVATAVALIVPGLRLALADKQEAVDLQLVLAVDASGSVNTVRFEMQKRGYVDAFRNPRVLKAIQSGSLGRIAVTMVQWTGPSMQVQTVPWTLIAGQDSVEAFARRVEAAPRQLFGGGTSISGAIDHGVELLKRSPFSGGRKVIDVSGDGANNRGRPSMEARDDAIATGISINGLPILELEPDLDRFYQNNVIGGPNSFMIVAKTFEEFGEAVLKKLVTEIASRPTFPLRVALTAPLAR